MPSRTHYLALSLLLPAALACNIQQSDEAASEAAVTTAELPAAEAFPARSPEQFKYASIGTDKSQGIPYWVFKAMPEICKDKMPTKTSSGGWDQFGMIQESGHDLPVGFSKRRTDLGYNNVGFTCSLCHAGSARTQPSSKRQVFLGAPNARLSIADYLRFVQDCLSDTTTFNANSLEAYLRKNRDFMSGDESARDPKLATPEAQLKTLSTILPLISKQMTQISAATAPLLRAATRPGIAPGQTDSFNFIAATLFPDLKSDFSVVATADWPQIWNGARKQPDDPRVKPLQPRVHWDGNQACTVERDVAAAVSSGALPAEVELSTLAEMRAWSHAAKAPKFDSLFPLPADAQQRAQVTSARARGKKLFYEAKLDVEGNTCATCHAAGGSKVGGITPAEVVGTDEARFQVVGDAILKKFETIAVTSPSEYEQHKERTGEACLVKHEGYVNRPLVLSDPGDGPAEGDGLFLLGPYLHNGSVPTLWDLLQAPSERPSTFCRGSDVVDPVNVGFMSTGVGCVEEIDGRTQRYFTFDTRANPGKRAVTGVSNKGHLWGTDLAVDAKRDLLEFLKTL